jgi:hypothetical protein
MRTTHGLLYTLTFGRMTNGDLPGPDSQEPGLHLIERLGPHRRQGRRAISGQLHMVAHAGEPVPHDRRDLVIVLHNQDAFAHGAASP